MFVLFTDELFLGFETICSNFTGLWYGQEQLGYPAQLIVIESCSINICAADISQKVVSLQLKGYTLTEWQYIKEYIKGSGMVAYLFFF
jgi:hypothetical protein